MDDKLSVSVFNSLVLNRLFESGFQESDVLCVGVSGGADSICLLTSLAYAFEEKFSQSEKSFEIYVVTVDHKIRCKKESRGDCDFVKEHCKKLSLQLKKVKIYFNLLELQKGQVLKTQNFRARGLEEAARFLRYEIFKKFATKILEKKNKARAFFALAHNENDQLETLIMRFLSGSGIFSRSGIQEKRIVSLEDNKILIFVRPLLHISRNEIEEYLNLQSILWRTDSTNLNNEYLRNKIRNLIIPILDENIPGWKTGVLAGSEKAFLENSFIEKNLGNLEWQKNQDSLFVKKSEFEKLDFIQKERFLYKAFDILNPDSRIPFQFIKKIASKNYECSKNGIKVCLNSESLEIKKIKKMATTYGFFVIIEKDGLYNFDFGKLFVKNCQSSFAQLEFVTNNEQNYYLNNVPVPFVFRSRQILDFVLTKTKSKKSVSDVLSDFKVTSEHKNLIPVLEHIFKDGTNQIIAVWGNIFGYKNWIV